MRPKDLLKHEGRGISVVFWSGNGPVIVISDLHSDLYTSNRPKLCQCVQQANGSGRYA